MPGPVILGAVMHIKEGDMTMSKATAWQQLFTGLRLPDTDWVDTPARDVSGAVATRERFVPAIETIELDGWVCIRAELPGVSESDIAVRADGNVLTITGRKCAMDPRVADSYRSERNFGQFSRELALPAGAELHRATAWLRNGVLEIDVPLGSPKAGIE